MPLEQDRDSQMAGPSRIPQQISKPKKKPLCKRLCNYCYNKEKKTCMNRSGKHCLLLLFYFILFFGIMTIIFILLWYAISEQALKLDSRPYVKIQHSDSPCPTLVPTLLSSAQELGVWYALSGGESLSASQYVKAITSFYKGQEKKCAELNDAKCPFEKDDFGPCGGEDYGYGNKTPCVYVKLNVLDGYSPSAFETQSKIHSDIPKELSKEINVTRKTVWVHCKGETPYDTELIGKVKYYPDRGFKDEFFPTSKASRINPFVAIQLEELAKDRVLSLDCGIFGHDYDSKMSHVHVYLYIGV